MRAPLPPPRTPPHASAAPPAVARLAVPLLVLAACAACGGASATPAAPVGRTPPPAAPALPATTSRLLARDATFATLVAAARGATERGDDRSEAGCLLRVAGPEGGAHALEADLAVAIRPLPAAPADAHARLAGDPAARAAILTVWGLYGAAAPDVPVLAALTTAPPALAVPRPDASPASAALAVALAADGRQATRWIADASVDTTALDAVRDAVPIYLTADASTPIETVARALDALSQTTRGALALAVLLPPGTRLPAETAVEDEGASCPEGLPPADAPEGSIPPDALREGVAPVEEAVVRCTQAGAGPVARGGALDVHLRIGPDGTVVDACATRDDIGDPGFRRCLLESVRALSFPPPSPTGIVEASLPFRLPPADGLRQQALCADR